MHLLDLAKNSTLLLKSLFSPSETNRLVNCLPMQGQLVTFELIISLGCRYYIPAIHFYEKSWLYLFRCLAKELHVHYASKKIRKVRLDEHPLQLQYHFLQELGHSEIHRMQLEGLYDLSTLIKFVAGK